MEGRDIEEQNIIVGKRTSSERRLLQDFGELATDMNIEEEKAQEGLEDISKKIATYGTTFRDFNKLNFSGLDFAFANHIVSPLTYLSKVKRYDKTVARVLDSKWIKYVIRGIPSIGKKKVLYFIKIVIQDGGAKSTEYDDLLESLGRFAYRLNMKKYLEKTEKVAKRLKLRESDINTVLTKMKLLF